MSSTSGLSAEIVRLNYTDFTIWLDCEKRGPTAFMYVVSTDNGNLDRQRRFHLDPSAPEYCQQKSSLSYVYPGVAYDRGHMVPANHLDHSPVAIAQSNYMTNILPQEKTLNRSAWLATEEMVECNRDTAEITVMGGAIWGDDASNDYFVGSHGVTTPDRFWKILKQGDKVIAWIFPNSRVAQRSRMDDFIVSISEIENITGVTIPVPEKLKDVRAARQWTIPKGCNKG
jgi:endonuclease G